MGIGLIKNVTMPSYRSRIYEDEILINLFMKKIILLNY